MPEFFIRLGQIAKAVGSDEFYEEVADLIGEMIPHEYVVIYRYSLHSPPEQLYACGFGQHANRYYLEHGYEQTDPFYNYWRNTNKYGVVSLRDVAGQAEDANFYQSVYLPKFGTEDEAGVLFQGLGNACIAIFIGRRSGRFSNTDLRRARLVFPCLEGIHKAHVRQLIGKLIDKPRSDVAAFSRPTLIVNQHGEQIYANKAWHRAVRRYPDICRMTKDWKPGWHRERQVSPGLSLHMQVFDRDFSLAPAGRFFILESQADPENQMADIDLARSNYALLSQREKQIVDLMMEGARFGDMAVRLGLSKGTIKNYRLNIYKKLAISSERALFLCFLPIMTELRKTMIAPAMAAKPDRRKTN